MRMGRGYGRSLGITVKNVDGINYLLYEEKGGVVVDNFNSWDGGQIIDAEIKAQPGSNVMLLNNGQITPMTN